MRIDSLCFHFLLFRKTAKKKNQVQGIGPLPLLQIFQFINLKNIKK